jgi:hypothetical protein
MTFLITNFLYCVNGIKEKKKKVDVDFKVKSFFLINLISGKKKSHSFLFDLLFIIVPS